MATQPAPSGRILVVEDEDSISHPFAEALSEPASSLW
jgi:hypothetical protein